MNPTNDEIQSEIKALREVKPSVRQETLFGDDNHKAIDVQVRVLTEKLSEDNIYDKWGDNDHLRDAALEAWAWLNGESEYPSLVDVWKELI